MFVVAHISDLHFNCTRFTRNRIESTLGYINARADGIDALLVTGDIADEGTDAEYREAGLVLDSPIPMIVTAGNHDDRARFNTNLLRRDSVTPVNTARVINGVLFLVADSSIPGQNDGFIPDETIAWMDEQLVDAGPSTRVLVAFHHPPVTLGMPFMDSIKQTGEDRVAQLVARHPNIIAFVCGHAHTGAVTTFAGRPLCVAPGVASTLNLPFEGHDIVNRGQPPGIAFHILEGNRIITHYRSVMF